MNEPIDLAYLVHHWSDAYDVNMRHGRYQAIRRDDGSAITRDTAEQLLAEIRDEYRIRPVPRDLPTAPLKGSGQ